MVGTKLSGGVSVTCRYKTFCDTGGACVSMEKEKGKTKAYQRSVW